MEKLLKIVVVLLFVALAAIVIVTGVQKVYTKEVNYDPGPQVPVEEIDAPALEIEIDATIPLDGTATSSEIDEESLVACTADSRMCPDGSAVGRTGPNCEFQECPKQTITVSISCTEAQNTAEICTMEYAPVCGLVEVQCVTTPCDPVPKTFGNVCGACAQGNVLSYTEGVCTL